MKQRQFLELGAVAGGAIAVGGPARGWWTTATAQPATIPAVDRVVMTVVVDNAYDIFAKGGKIEERAMAAGQVKDARPADSG